MPRSQEGFQWTPTSTTYGLETEAVVISTPKTQLRKSYDAIVIGTGFTGLIAARDLSIASSSNVLLVDARDRIGGRTWTVSALGEQFEMGGTWIHWNQPHVFAELHRYGLHKVIKPSNGTLDPRTVFYKPAAGAVEEVSKEEMYAGIEKIGTLFFSPDGLTSRDLMPYPHEPFRQPALWTKYDHLSIKDRMEQIPGQQDMKDYFEVMMNSIGSGPGIDIGFVEPLRWYALGGHSVVGMFEIIETFKVGGGGQTALARCILGDYRGHLKMNTVVKEIQQSPQGVVMQTTSGETFQAKYVICTVPLNCLGDVKFSPAFSPLRQEAIKRGHMNKGAKFHFKLASPEPGWLAMANSYGTSPWLLSFSDHNGTRDSAGRGNYCIAFGYNGYNGKPEASEEIVSSFKEYMKPGAQVLSYLTHDWANDPYAKGAWSAWNPGDMTKYLAELQKDHGRVLMASSDWAEGWRGFIDGAIERGGVAARDVQKRLASIGDGSLYRL